ncbi:MAG TPA: polymer-forming cytoskeletal protein [Xanthomonadales bacterium]|nr:polymer-forming cytoskeletal protein [Xanthomonadales bacterium]
MFDKRKDKNQNPPHVGESDPIQHAAAPVSASIQAVAKAAVIGPGIAIDGNISGNENLLIEGKVKGSIHLGSHEVTVGKTGDVNADVTAKLIRIAGKVRGDLTGKEKVIISNTGNVRGNIVAPRMLLEDGAVFKGSIDMDPGETSQAQAPLAAAKVVVKPAAVSDTSATGPDLALKSG